MQTEQTKLERWAYLVGWHIAEWVLNISILILAWNYLCADFFGMVKMSIPNAIGILIIKNVMFLSKQKKPESDIQFYHN
jgi:hypothetical protein